MSISGIGAAAAHHRPSGLPPAGPPPAKAAKDGGDFAASVASAQGGQAKPGAAPAGAAPETGKPLRKQQHEGDALPPQADNRFVGGQHPNAGKGVQNHYAFRAYTPAAPPPKATASLLA